MAKRVGFKMQLKDESVIAEYERLHEDIGDEVRAAHTRAGMSNYSIFRDGLTLFARLECDDFDAAIKHMEENEPIMEEWWAKTNPLMQTDETGNKPLFVQLREVFYMD